MPNGLVVGENDVIARMVIHRPHDREDLLTFGDERVETLVAEMLVEELDFDPVEPQLVSVGIGAVPTDAS